MNDDEQFAQGLRDRVTRVAPQIDVDVTSVVPAARRRRAARTGGITLVLALALGGGAWVATTLEPTVVVPGGSTTMPVEPSPTPTGPPLTTSEGDRLGDVSDNVPQEPVIPPEGWREASYFHLVTRVMSTKEGEEDDDNTPLGIERWYGDGVSFELRSYGPALRDSHSFLGLEGNQPVSLGWSDVAALPTEPDALQDALLEALEVTGVAEEAALSNTARLVTDAPATPALRAAAWQLLISHPDVQVDDDVQDSEDRPGTSATFELWDRTTTIIYDEEQQRPLELEESIGKMHSLTTYFETEFTDLPDEVADSVIEVPDLTAMTREDVEVACLQKHLTCVLEDAASDTVPEGTVISSDPTKGALVSWGALVTVVLSTGP